MSEEMARLLESMEADRERLRARLAAETKSREQLQSQLVRARNRARERDEARAIARRWYEPGISRGPDRLRWSEDAAIIASWPKDTDR